MIVPAAATAPFARYLFAVLITGFTLLLKVLVVPLIEGDAPFLVLILAVAASAWYGGLGPGLLSACIAAFFAHTLFLNPGGGFLVPSPGEALVLGLFAGEAALISWLIQALRSAVGRAAESKEALARSERRLRETFSHAASGIGHESVDGKWLRVNRRLCEILGASEEELLGGAGEALTHPRDREADRAHLARILAGEPGARALERRCTRPDGSQVWITITRSLVRDAEGRPEYVISIVEDISERKRMEEALRDSESRFRSLVESAKDAVVLADGDGCIVAWNGAAAAAFGYSEAEARGMPVARLLPERLRGGRQGWDGVAAADAAGGPRSTIELFGLRKDGREFPIELSLASWEAGARLFSSAIIRDVTERRQLEEQFRQAQKMEAVGRLAGGVAHDFNNMLAVINGYAELLLLRECAEDPVTRNHLEEVQAAGQRAIALTRQLLAFSRKQVLSPQILDLNGAVRNVERMLDRLIGEDVLVRTTLDPELGLVRADPGQVEQVVLNLAVNARDAMPQGGELTIETRNVELDESYTRRRAGVRPGAYAMLAVSDNGCGIDAQTRSRIFEPFFTTKEPGRGTGLGLATVYAIAQQSGGHVQVESEPGRGSTFRVYFPRTDCVIQVQPGEFTIPPPARGTETILLVEDEQMVRSLVRTVLAGAGYSVLEAASGADAAALCRRYDGPIHLLLTDVVMPGSSGRETAELLLKDRPELRVLYISGYTDDAVTRHGVVEEEADLLLKPFTPDALARKVREVLDAARR